MEFLNVGLPELLIILILMFVLLGPKEMVRTAARIGSWVRSVIKSPMWYEVLNYSQEIRELPNKIMDESGLKETLEEVRKDTQAATDDINTQIKEVVEAARVKEAEHLRVEFNPQENQTIAPPAVNDAAAPAEAEPAQEKPADEPADLPAAEPAASPAAGNAAGHAAASPAPGGAISGAIAAAAAGAAAKAQARMAQKARATSPADQEVAATQEVSAQQEVAAQQEVSATQEMAATQELAAQNAPLADAKPVKPRAPRRKKTQEPAPPQPESEPAAVVPVAQQDEEPAEAPVVETPAVVPVAEPGKKTRGRKPKQAETASLNGAQIYVEPAAQIGSSPINSNGGTHSSQDAPVKAPRKPRARKAPTESAASQASPENGTGSHTNTTPEETPTSEEQSYRDAA